MPAAENRIRLSVIVPVFNEGASINILYEKIRQTLTALEEKTETIFINDGSTDESKQILSHLSDSDRTVKAFGFSSHCGQHKAIEKGFREARGEIVITMDGDLQNEPADIPKLLARLKQGFDLVCGWRVDRKGPWYKILIPKIGNHIQRRITGLNLHDMGCGMRACRKDIIKNLTLKNRYEIGLLPYILSRRTNKISEIKITHNKRIYGESKYKFSYVLGTICCYIRLILTRDSCR